MCIQETKNLMLQSIKSIKAKIDKVLLEKQANIVADTIICEFDSSQSNNALCF